MWERNTRGRVWSPSRGKGGHTEEDEKKNESVPNVTQGRRDAGMQGCRDTMHVVLFQANVVALESRGIPDIGPASTAAAVRIGQSGRYASRSKGLGG